MESEYYTALLPVPRKAKETLDLRIKNSVFVKEIFFRKIAHNHDFPLAWKYGGKEYKWLTRFILIALDEYLNKDNIRTFGGKMQFYFEQNVLEVIADKFRDNFEDYMNINFGLGMEVVEDGIEVSMKKSKIHEMLTKQNLAEYNKYLTSCGLKKTSSKQILSDANAMFVFFTFMQEGEKTESFLKENYNDIDLSFLDELFEKKKAVRTIFFEDVLEDLDDHLFNFFCAGNFEQEFERLLFQRDEYLRVQTKGETPERIAEIRIYADHNFRKVMRELITENLKYFCSNKELEEMETEEENA